MTSSDHFDSEDTFRTEEGPCRAWSYRRRRSSAALLGLMLIQQSSATTTKLFFPLWDHRDTVTFDDTPQDGCDFGNFDIFSHHSDPERNTGKESGRTGRNKHPRSTEDLSDILQGLLGNMQNPKRKAMRKKSKSDMLSPSRKQKKTKRKDEDTPGWRNELYEFEDYVEESQEDEDISPRGSNFEYSIDEDDAEDVDSVIPNSISFSGDNESPEAIQPHYDSLKAVLFDEDTDVDKIRMKVYEASADMRMYFEHKNSPKMKNAMHAFIRFIFRTLKATMECKNEEEKLSLLQLKLDAIIDGLGPYFFVVAQNIYSNRAPVEGLQHLVEWFRVNERYKMKVDTDLPISSHVFLALVELKNQKDWRGLKALFADNSVLFEFKSLLVYPNPWEMLKGSQALDRQILADRFEWLVGHLQRAIVTARSAEDHGIVRTLLQVCKPGWNRRDLDTFVTEMVDNFPKNKVYSLKLFKDITNNVYQEYLRDDPKIADFDEFEEWEEMIYKKEELVQEVTVPQREVKEVLRVARRVTIPLSGPSTISLSSKHSNCASLGASIPVVSGGVSDGPVVAPPPTSKMTEKKAKIERLAYCTMIAVVILFSLLGCCLYRLGLSDIDRFL